MVPGVLAAAVLVGVGACDARGGAATEAALDGAVGFGEQRDSAFGEHAVAGVVDLDPRRVRAPGLEVGDDDHLVAAVVSECAAPERSGVVERDGWSAVLDDGTRATSPVDPVPATEGAPPIGPSRRIAPGSCGWARVLFVVPERREVVGVHHEAPGARTTTWRASDRAPDEIG